MTRLADVAAWLESALGAPGPGEPPTLYRPSPRPVRRLGLALAPSDALAQAVATDALDAVLLHRPWGAEALGLRDDVGLLACHRPFDERLTLGHHPALAEMMTIRDAEPMTWKDGAVIGMLGEFSGGTVPALVKTVEDVFGGCDEVVPGRTDAAPRVAVANAMTDALVREAAARGATAYVTGQLRAPALRALRETGTCAIAVGHARVEGWALARLAGLLHQTFPAMHLHPLAPETPHPETAR